jgi:hypothetical protein
MNYARLAHFEAGKLALPTVDIPLRRDELTSPPTSPAPNRVAAPATKASRRSETTTVTLQNSHESSCCCAVRRHVRVHDPQATLLHLLDLDHKRLTFKFQGCNFRLTDVHGEVVQKLLA